MRGGRQGVPLGVVGAAHLAVAFLVEVIEDAFEAGLLLSTRVLLTRRHLLGHGRWAKRAWGLCGRSPGELKRPRRRASAELGSAVYTVLHTVHDTTFRARLKKTKIFTSAPLCRPVRLPGTSPVPRTSAGRASSARASSARQGAARAFGDDGRRRKRRRPSENPKAA